MRTPTMGRHTELIFVLGGSTDGTEDAVRSAMNGCPDRDIKMVLQPGVGKGDAVRAGFAAATGDVLIILDGDLTVSPEELPRFFDAVVSGQADLAVGCRLSVPMEQGAMRFLNIWGNRLFAWVVGRLIGQPLGDALCGTKALWAKDYRMASETLWLGREDPFGDFDLLFNAAKFHQKIIQLPVRYGSRVYGSTHIRRFWHGWKLFCLCWSAFRRLRLARQ
jgi:glycosyltransferase involved in cell wall biosynthesis